MTFCRLLLIFSVFIFCANTLSAQRFRNPKGNEFWVGFMSNYDTSGGSVDLSLHIFADQPMEVVIEVPKVGFSKTINVNTYTRYSFVEDSQAIDFDLEKKLHNLHSDSIYASGVRVYSANRRPFLLNVVNRKIATFDAALALPNWAWGTEYRVSAYYDGRNPMSSIEYEGFSEFMLVALDDSTDIQITPQADVIPLGNRPVKPKGIPYTLRLNRGEVYLAISKGNLNASRVSASKPIAVYGGNVCAFVGKECCCDHLFESVLPEPPLEIENRFQSYILAGNRSRHADYFQITTLKDSTTIRYYDRPDQYSTLLVDHAGDSVVLELPTFSNHAAITLEADQPVFVSWLNLSQGTDTTRNVPSDPFLSQLVPTDLAQSYNGNVYFMRFADNDTNFIADWKHYLNLVIQKSDSATVRINNRLLSELNNVRVIPVNGDSSHLVVGVAFEDSLLLERLIHVQCQSCIAYIYGQSYFDSYGTSPQVAHYPMLNNTPTGNPEPIASPKPSTNVALSANPITDDTKINLNLVKATSVETSLYDLTGRTVWTKTGNYGIGSASIALDAKDLKAGIYLLKVSTDYDQKSLKVIVR